MKQLQFSILLTFFISLSAISQNIAPCATVETEAGRAALMKLKPQLKNYQKSDQRYYVPIKFHHVAEDNGEGRWTRFDIIQNLADINEDYDAYNIQFFMQDNDVDDHNNSNVYNHENYGVDNFMNSNDDESAVNVYFVENPAGACGYYTYGGDGIMINHSCGGIASTTLTHELGHYFGLPHTFSGWEYGTPGNGQIERVPRDGSSANCEYAGDSFCGTGPDYVPDRWPCPYGELEDPIGNKFTPDSSFYMSYSSDICQARHSYDQVASIKANIDTYRPYLKNHNTNDYENTDEINKMYLVYPANEATVPTTVTIQWEPVLGATHYALYAKNVNDNIPIVDVFIDETNYTFENLNDGEKIFWQVRAFHAGNYSSVPPSGRRFNVKATQIIDVESFEVNHPSCANAFDASISVEVKGGTPPYEFVWGDGTEGNSLENIPYGRYILTVTDAEGVSNDLDFFINQPEHIQSDVVIGLNNTVAIVNGGTAPFTYEWSGSDETTKVASNLPAGLNTLTVTDVNGCEDETEFRYIKPTVVQNNVTCFGDDNGSLFIYGAEGGESGNYTFEWEDGSNSFIRENLTAGDYTLKVTDSQGNNTVAVYSVTAAEQPIQIAANQINYDIVLIYSGGVEPFEFNWSDGGTGYARLDLEPGTYTVYVTDANGCSLQETYTVAAIETGIEILNGFAVNGYLNNNSNLVLETNAQNEVINVELYNIEGKLLLTDVIDSGESIKNYNINNLAAGVYLLRVNTGNEYKTIKLVK